MESNFNCPTHNGLLYLVCLTAECQQRGAICHYCHQKQHLSHEVRELRSLTEDIQKKRFANPFGSQVEKCKAQFKNIKIELLEAITKQKQDIVAQFDALTQATSSYFDMSIGIIETSVNGYFQLLQQIVQPMQSEDVNSFKAATQKKVDGLLRSFRMERRLLNLLQNCKEKEAKDKEETLSLIQGFSEIKYKMQVLRKRLNKDDISTKYGQLTERPINKSAPMNPTVSNSAESIQSTASSNSVHKVSATMTLTLNNSQPAQIKNSLWIEKQKHKDLNIFNEYIFRKQNICKNPVGALINKKLTAQDTQTTTWKFKIKSIGNNGVIYLGIALSDYFNSHNGELTNKDYINHRHYMISSKGKKYHSDRTSDNNTITQFSFGNEESVQLSWLPKEKILQICNSQKKAELRGIMMQPGATYRPCVYFDCETGTVKLLQDEL